MMNTSISLRIFTALAFAGLAACNEKVVVEEPKATEEGEPLVGAAADPLYIGVWAADKELCAVAPGEPGPVEFTADQFLGYENTCDILSSEEGTDGGWRLEMRCTGEGQTVMETADVDLDGERLRISRNGGEPVTFYYCDADGEEQANGGL
ncbi:hypothetical protein [Hyphococcus sp.]|uniref:hypothetical protein n=1 Tax=Hyphococcus sp. TaxID=2038636 RepID=UPI003CCBAD1C